MPAARVTPTPPHARWRACASPAMRCFPMWKLSAGSSPALADAPREVPDTSFGHVARDTPMRLVGLKEVPSKQTSTARALDCRGCAGQLCAGRRAQSRRIADPLATGFRIASPSGHDRDHWSIRPDGEARGEVARAPTLRRGEERVREGPNLFAILVE